MPTTQKTTWSLYERPDAPPAFRFTERDYAFLRSLARYRYADTALLHQLDGGSLRNVQKSLQVLWAHNLIDRPKLQIVKAIADGRPSKMIYGLTRAGANLIAERDSLDAELLEWSTKRKHASDMLLHHTLDVARFMVPMEIASRASPTLRIVDHHQMLPLMPTSTVDTAHRFTLKTTVKHRNRAAALSLTPDRLFLLHTSDATVLPYALEKDRGTMTVTPAQRSLKKATIWRKFFAYHQAYLDGEHTKRWGVQRFRVLFATTTQARIDKMIGALDEVLAQFPPAQRRPGLFLFTDAASLQPEGPLGPIWQNNKGERLALIPEVTA